MHTLSSIIIFVITLILVRIGRFKSFLNFVNSIINKFKGNKDGI